MKLFWSCLIAMLMFSCKLRTDSSLISGKNDSSLFIIISPEESGINFKNIVTPTVEMNGLTYMNYHNGSGLAVADFNNDGFQDIYFMSTLNDNNLYLNNGDMKFKDVSEISGTQSIAGFHTGVTAVDINCDGWMDLYICNAGNYDDPELRKNKLLVNLGVNKDGIPVFREESSKYGLDIDLCSTQSVFFDFDRDGDLDMFLANSTHDTKATEFRSIETLLKSESKITGDRLYENRKGTFVDISKRAGMINNSLIMSLGVGVSDLNNDGWPDIYVCNDFLGKDHLYLNNGNGTFTESSNESLNHMSHSSMGNDLADFNNDGWADIITLDMIPEDNYSVKTSSFWSGNGSLNLMVFKRLAELGLHIQCKQNMLQMNNGIINKDQVPFFSDIAQLTGISNTDWSWGPLLFDIDNDGNKDLFVANGTTYDYLNYDFYVYFNKKIQELIKTGQLSKDNFLKSPLTLSIMNQMPHRKKSNYFFRNNGDLTFDKMNGIWVQDSLAFSNGAAYADFDNDGDIDLVVNNSEGPSYLYKNICNEKGLGNFLQFKLKGPANNPLGIGTKIILRNTDKIQVLEQYLTRGFQSSVTTVLHFGLGTDTIVSEIEVIWPDGKNQVIVDIPANQCITLFYKDASKIHDFSLSSPSIIEDVTKTLNINSENKGNNPLDFNGESVFLHQMSDVGTGIAVGDINRDGLEDFYIGGTAGKTGKLFIQTNSGFIVNNNNPWYADARNEDNKAYFFDADNDNDLDLYLVSGGDKYEEGSEYLQDRLYLNNGSIIFQKAQDALPDLRISGSCVKGGDYDGDGDVDLFIGGRQKPGKYPLPVSSYLLRNDSKAGEVLFTDVTADVIPGLKDIGMVTDANWADIDSDGKHDLLIVGEWMSPKLFKNDGNNFKNMTENSGLSQETGWWNCIASGDFDNDNDIDFVTGNLGLNYNYKANKEYPFELYFKDFDNNGEPEIVLGYYNEGILYPFFGRDRSANKCPFIYKKFPTYDSFGKATLEEIYGSDNLQTALNLKAKNFASCYFENLGNRSFRVFPLKHLAQISSVNSILVHDCNGDGNLDIIVAGNMYGTDIETVRNDSSIGLLLKGDGAGNFEPVPFTQSGLFIKGEVTEIALIHLGQARMNGFIALKSNGSIQICKINDRNTE